MLKFFPCISIKAKLDFIGFIDPWIQVIFAMSATVEEGYCSDSLITDFNIHCDENHCN